MSTSENSLPKRLRGLGFGSYSDYLRSEHWLLFKKRFFGSKLAKRMYREYGFLVCEFCKCGNRQLNVHHRTYKRLGMEWLMDVNLLCNDCHLLIHTLPRSGRNNYLFKRTKKIKRYYK